MKQPRRLYALGVLAIAVLLTAALFDDEIVALMQGTNLPENPPARTR